MTSAKRGGRIESGKAGDGTCYGYRAVRRLENGVVTTEEVLAQQRALKRGQYARLDFLPGDRLEASDALRGLIDSIVLTPEKGQLRIELRGNLAAMFTIAQQTRRSPETGDLFMPVQMVAGARNRQYRLLSTWWPHERQRSTPAPRARRDARPPVSGVSRRSLLAILHRRRWATVHAADDAPCRVHKPVHAAML